MYIRSADGRTVRARTAIVTVPLHALNAVDFEPPLPAAKTEGFSLGQVSKGAKVWFRLRGDHAPFVALGGADWPLNFFQVEYALDGDTIAVGFGPDASRIDVEDPAAVQAQLERLVPGAEVVAVASHNWVDDPLSGETWPMHRTGLSVHVPTRHAGGARPGPVCRFRYRQRLGRVHRRRHRERHGGRYAASLWRCLCAQEQQLIAAGQAAVRDGRCHAGFHGAACR